MSEQARSQRFVEGGGDMGEGSKGRVSPSPLAKNCFSWASRRKMVRYMSENWQLNFNWKTGDFTPEKSWACIYTTQFALLVQLRSYSILRWRNIMTCWYRCGDNWENEKSVKGDGEIAVSSSRAISFQNGDLLQTHHLCVFTQFLGCNFFVTLVKGISNPPTPPPSLRRCVGIKVTSMCKSGDLL